MRKLYLVALVLFAMSSCGGNEDLRAPDLATPAGPAHPARPTVTAEPSSDGGSSDGDAEDDVQGPTGSPVVLATPDGSVTAVAVVGTNVYFSLYGMGIYAVPSAGGATTPIVSAGAAPAGDFQPFAFDSTSVYWAANCYGTCNRTIERAPIGGGPATVVAQASGFIAGIAVDGANVYWLDQDNGEVLGAPVTGGTAAVVAGGLATPAAIAIHGGTIYLTDAASDLLSVPEIGGAVTTLVKGPGLPPNTEVDFFSTQLAVDNSYVYFPQYYAPTPIVARVPLSGGAVTALANGAASGIAIDADNVYWVPGGGSGATVNEVPIAGGAGRVLAAGQVALVGPAVDATSVYWGTSQVTTASCGPCPPPMVLGTNAVLALRLGGLSVPDD